VQQLSNANIFSSSMFNFFSFREHRQDAGVVPEDWLCCRWLDTKAVLRRRTCLEFVQKSMRPTHRVSLMQVERLLVVTQIRALYPSL
jgi:hypothetical protein